MQRQFVCFLFEAKSKIQFPHQRLREPDEPFDWLPPPMPAVSLVKSKLQTPPANRKASSNVKKDPELEEKGAAVLSSSSASQDFQDQGWPELLVFAVSWRRWRLLVIFTLIEWSLFF